MSNNFSEKMSYKQAMKRIEEITSKIEKNQVDVDELSHIFKEACRLIAICKEKLSKTQMEVKRIQESTEKDGESETPTGQDEEGGSPFGNEPDQFTFDDENIEIPF